MAFTASTADLTLPFSGYLDQATVSLRGTSAVAAVLASTLADLLQPLEIKLNNTAVISARGRDLFALSNLWLGQNPIAKDAVAATGQPKIHGISVPVWGQPKHGTWSIRGNRVAQTNLSSEVWSVDGEVYDKVLHDGYLNILSVFFTPPSSGAAFNTAADLQLGGDLLGLLFFSTTVPTDTADTISCRSVQLYRGGTLYWQQNWKDLQSPDNPGAYPQTDSASNVLGAGYTAFLQNFAWYDTTDDPIPKGERVVIKIQSDDTSAIRILPVIQFK